MQPEVQSACASNAACVNSCMPSGSRTNPPAGAQRPAAAKGLRMEAVTTAESEPFARTARGSAAAASPAGVRAC